MRLLALQWEAFSVRYLVKGKKTLNAVSGIILGFITKNPIGWESVAALPSKCMGKANEANRRRPNGPQT